MNAIAIRQMKKDFSKVHSIAMIKIVLFVFLNANCIQYYNFMLLG